MKRLVLRKRIRSKSSNCKVLNREELIIQFLPFAKSIAERISLRLPKNVEIDELIAAGIIGLMDAVDKFDPSKQIKFKTYAEFRIRGSILDGLRAMDWLPRSLRRKITQVEDTYSRLEQELGRPATDKEVADHLQINVSELHDMLKSVRGKYLISLDEPIDGEAKGKTLLECLCSPESKDPFASTRFREMKEMIAKVIDNLPEKERLVISLYYYEELTMKEIGQIMDVTESRISQIHTKATITLKNKLKKVANF